MHTDPRYALRLSATNNLRATAVAVCLGLVVTIVAAGYTLAAIAAQRSLIDQAVTGDRFVATSQAAHADHRAHVANLRWEAAAIGTAVLFVIWFWQLRRNAAVFAPSLQRRSQPWAIWGWICPIVSFWFPLQIALDALRSTGASRTASRRLVATWWVVFVAAVVVSRVLSAGSHTATLDQLQSLTAAEAFSAALDIVAAVLAVLVVVWLTRCNDDYRYRALRDPTGGPLPVRED